MTGPPQRDRRFIHSSLEVIKTNLTSPVSKQSGARTVQADVCDCRERRSRFKK